MALRKVGIVKTDREINSMFREVGKGVGSFISFNEFKSIIGGGEASSVVPSVYEEN